MSLAITYRPNVLTDYQNTHKLSGIPNTLLFDETLPINNETWKKLCFFYTQGGSCSEQMEKKAYELAFASVAHLTNHEKQAKALFTQFQNWLALHNILNNSEEYWVHLFNACCFLRKNADEFVKLPLPISDTFPFIHLLYRLQTGFGIQQTIALLDVLTSLIGNLPPFLTNTPPIHEIQLAQGMFLRWQGDIQSSIRYLNEIARNNNPTDVELEQLFTYFTTPEIPFSFLSHWLQSEVPLFKALGLLFLSNHPEQANVRLALSVYPKLAAEIQNTTLKKLIAQKLEAVFGEKMPEYEDKSLFLKQWIAVLFNLRNKFSVCEDILYRVLCSEKHTEEFIHSFMPSLCIESPSFAKRLILLFKESESVLSSCLVLLKGRQECTPAQQDLFDYLRKKKQEEIKRFLKDESLPQYPEEKLLQIQEELLQEYFPDEEEALAHLTSFSRQVLKRKKKCYIKSFQQIVEYVARDLKRFGTQECLELILAVLDRNYPSDQITAQQEGVNALILLPEIFFFSTSFDFKKRLMPYIKNLPFFFEKTELFCEQWVCTLLTMPVRSETEKEKALSSFFSYVFEELKEDKFNELFKEHIPLAIFVFYDLLLKVPKAPYPSKFKHLIITRFQSFETAVGPFNKPHFRYSLEEGEKIEKLLREERLFIHPSQNESEDLLIFLNEKNAGIIKKDELKFYLNLENIKVNEVEQFLHDKDYEKAIKLLTTFLDQYISITCLQNTDFIFNSLIEFIPILLSNKKILDKELVKNFSCCLHVVMFKNSKSNSSGINYKNAIVNMLAVIDEYIPILLADEELISNKKFVKDFLYCLHESIYLYARNTKSGIFYKDAIPNILTVIKMIANDSEMEINLIEDALLLLVHTFQAQENLIERDETWRLIKGTAELLLIYPYKDIFQATEYFLFNMNRSHKEFQNPGFGIEFLRITIQLLEKAIDHYITDKKVPTQTAFVLFYESLTFACGRAANKREHADYASLVVSAMKCKGSLIVLFDNSSMQDALQLQWIELGSLLQMLNFLFPIPEVNDRIFNWKIAFIEATLNTAEAISSEKRSIGSFASKLLQELLKEFPLKKELIKKLYAQAIRLKIRL